MEIIQPKKINEKKQNQLANEVYNVNKYVSINNHLKYQWTKCANQKTWSGRLDKKAKKPSIFCLQETHLRAKDTYRLKVGGREKMFHANDSDRNAEVAVFISDKINFKTKAIKKDKERHYLMVKGSIEEKDITIINIHAPVIGAPIYLQQIVTDIKREINGNTIIVGNCNTPLTSMHRSSRQKSIRQQRSYRKQYKS